MSYAVTFGTSLQDHIWRPQSEFWESSIMHLHHVSHIGLNDFTFHDFMDYMQVVRKRSQNSEIRNDKEVKGHIGNFTATVRKTGQLESWRACRNKDTGRNGTSIRATMKKLWPFELGEKSSKKAGNISKCWKLPFQQLFPNRGSNQFGGRTGSRYSRTGSGYLYAG